MFETVSTLSTVYQIGERNGVRNDDNLKKRSILNGDWEHVKPVHGSLLRP